MLAAAAESINFTGNSIFTGGIVSHREEINKFFNVLVCLYDAKPEIVLLQFGRHIALSSWRPRPLKTISGFAFVDIAAFRRSKSMSKPNFVDIS